MPPAGLQYVVTAKPKIIIIFFSVILFEKLSDKVAKLTHK